MDRQWRPTTRPIQFNGNMNINVCPTCFIPHFPFCPHPPPSPPYYPQPFSRPTWPPPYDHPNPIGDGDRNFKRPRIDVWDEDERRLKLIRDHGQATLPNPPPPPQLHLHLHHNNTYAASTNLDPHRDRDRDRDRDRGAVNVNVNVSAPYRDDPNTLVLDFHGNQYCENMEGGSRLFRGQPPLPSSPPPPLPSEPPLNHSSHFNTYFSPPHKPPSLFPVPSSSSSSSAAVPPSSYSQLPQPHPYFHPKPPLPQFSAHDHHYLGDPQPFSLKPAHKPKLVDASHLFRHPHRTSRPDHFVIIFRGLPGSGKSYLAKMLRDLEVENGGDAPRIHSLDDYFMTEVEKVEDNDASKSSSSGRNKKPVTKKVMEYCYEPEMEEAYRSSMLKAFKKTVEEGVYTFIIVDDRNLRVADFAQFWATAKRSGYEVYILEATYKDPAGCAARNVHGFTQEDIEKMAGQWEEAPSLYLQLDVKSLFHGDDLKESRIQEVDMDMEDDLGDALPAVEGREAEKVVDPPVRDDASSLKDGKRWDAEGEHPTEVRELGKSKWSEDFGEDDTDQTEGMKGNINALSGLIHQYGKERKSVHWGDQVGNTGFSIGAARKVNALSLVIGPGAGYNLKSNPLPEEESPNRNSVEPKQHIIFQERIRAERESFKAVFDRRRQRIGGFDVEED